MYELMMLQETFVNNAWNLLAAIMSGFMVLSGIALFWARKARAALANSKDETAKQVVSFIDKWVVPILEEGQRTVQATEKQEVKIKQLGEILYGMFPEKAAEIKDKYEVKLVNLQKDVESAVKGSQEYNQKFQELEALIQEIRTGILTKSAV